MLTLAYRAGSAVYKAKSQKLKSLFLVINPYPIRHERWSECSVVTFFPLISMTDQRNNSGFNKMDDAAKTGQQNTNQGKDAERTGEVNEQEVGKEAEDRQTMAQGATSRGNR